DVQGGLQGNLITVGSTTVGLNGLNGSIDITGNTGVRADLTIEDSGSTVGHEYVMDDKSAQRLDKPRIGYQHVSTLVVRAGTQKDHIVVQNTIPSVGFGTGTTIAMSGGDDQIDVSRTTGPLSVYPGGHGVVTVGDAT